MSLRNVFGPDYFMLQNERRMQTYEAMVDFMNGRPAPYDLLFNALECGRGFGVDYADNLDDFAGEDDDDDSDESASQNRGYCGFRNNFLGERFPKYVPAATRYKAPRATHEEALKNAEELVAEEEKLKKKAEKKKQKKMRQRERRRLEKLEKENLKKDPAKKDSAAVAVKLKTTDRDCDSNNKQKKNSVPPDPGPQSSSVTTESSDSYDEEEDDDDESVVDELELDMSSCFVSNAAAIAKRKLEQKPDKKVDQKHDQKNKKSESQKNYTTGQKSTSEHQIAHEEIPEELKKDNVTKSMELAVVGNRCAQTGNLDMAVKYFTDAIKHNPQEYKLFGNRSFCYEKMQQHEKALIDADIALSLNPQWIKGLYRKGKALVGLKKYSEAGVTYKQVLKIDSSCTDAAQELMRVQIMQLMDMGYTKEQSTNALIIHGTVEKALEALSGLQGNMAPAQFPTGEIRVCQERNPQASNFPPRTVPQNPPKVSLAVPATPELFPVWVGDLAPAISQGQLHKLFSNFGYVHSVRLLSARRCAFVNFINKEDCEKAIKEMNGFRISGTYLVVRYPDRIHTHLGVSRAATTDTGKGHKFPDECCFWRTTGCIKTNRCLYRHVPEHKGIDRPKAK